MRQGCISSPIIFFINDLVSYLRASGDNGIFTSNEIEEFLDLMFADDVSSFSDTVARLQRQINSIENFCKSTKTSLNLNKNKIIAFRNGGIVKKVDKWYFQGSEIEIVSLYKYLGVYFTPKSIWNKTKELLARHDKRAAFSIFNFQKHFGHFYHSDSLELFDLMVKPIACYGAEIWGNKYIKEIERY